ncbi:MAG: MFS transporter [Clostridia bacterium]|nr:MFS transporter [Clostridia bacterium]
MTQNNYKKQAYFAFIWHGVFLALTLAMLDLNTVFPALIDEMTHSKIIFGFLYAIMLGIPLIFNIVFSHYLKTFKRKKKFLLFGIYLRSFSFLAMAAFTYFFSESKPLLTTGSFFLWIFLFSISAGFAGISYSDIIGKTLESKDRISLYTVKQFLSSIMALIGGLIIKKIFGLPQIDYPVNYAISLSIGGIGLFVASIGFWFMKEPESKIKVDHQLSLKDYLKSVPHIIKTDVTFKKFIIVENLASFSIMILPFYMIFAKTAFNIGVEYIGNYLLFQITGTIVSNLVWGLIAKRRQSKGVVTTCIFIGAFLPIVALILSFTTPLLYGAVFFLIGFIISGRRIGFEPLLLDIAPEDKRTEYLGIRGTLNIFIVILPILGGFFIESIGYYITFPIVSLVMLTAFFILRNTKNIKMAK